MASTLGDGLFHFPNYPLSCGQQVADVKTLVLDSAKASADEMFPWALENGFVTVFGETPNKAADKTWPAGSNAVLLGPLAKGNPRGTLLQHVEVDNASMLTLSFYARVSIADTDETSSCPAASMDVLLNDNVIGKVMCDSQWALKTMVIPLSQRKASVSIGFRDSTVKPVEANCISVVAGVTLTANTVDHLNKDAGDHQFAYLEETFRERLTAHPVDRQGKAVGGMQTTFEVVAGNVGLMPGQSDRVTLQGDAVTGMASVRVYGAAPGPATVRVSVPGGAPATFELFVGPDRGKATLSLTSSVVTVHQGGSDQAIAQVTSVTDGALLSYFPLMKGALEPPYSFDKADEILNLIPLGTTRSDGTFVLPSIYLRGIPAEKTLTIEFEGGSQRFNVIYRH